MTTDNPEYDLLDLARVLGQLASVIGCQATAGGLPIGKAEPPAQNLTEVAERYGIHGSLMAEFGPETVPVYELRDGAVHLTSEITAPLDWVETLCEPLDSDLRVDVLEVFCEARGYLQDGVSAATIAVYRGQEELVPTIMDKAFALAYSRCDARMWALKARIIGVWQLTCSDSALTAAEERDRWIYTECRKGTPYEGIIRQLRRKPDDWERIESAQGIRSAAQRYAKKHRLPEPETRQPGRPSKN